MYERASRVELPVDHKNLQPTVLDYCTDRQKPLLILDRFAVAKKKTVITKQLSKNN